MPDDYYYTINEKNLRNDTINEISNFHEIPHESARLLCTDEFMSEIV